MAFGTSAKPVFSRRTGIGLASLVAVNPSMKEINDAYGRQIYTDEPKYISEVEIDGKKFKQIRITFLLKFDENDKDNNGYSDHHFLTFTLTGRPVTNSDGTKIKVIDDFGRTAWVTNQEFEKKAIPVYSNGPARLSPNYHACLRNEDKLVNFIAALMCTPNIDVWNKTTKKWEINDKQPIENCKREIPADDMKKIFSGDVSPIKGYLDGDEQNKVKVLLGVRTDSNDGRKYTVVYDGAFMTQYQNKATQIERALADDIAGGRYSDTVFKIGPLVEVDSVKPDDLSKPVSVEKPSSFAPFDDLPFD